MLGSEVLGTLVDKLGSLCGILRRVVLVEFAVCAFQELQKGSRDLPSRTLVDESVVLEVRFGQVDVTVEKRLHMVARGTVRWSKCEMPVSTQRSWPQSYSMEDRT